MKKTEGEVFWDAFDGFKLEGYSDSVAKKAAHDVVEGKSPWLPTLKHKEKRPLPPVIRDYLRPFIKDELGDEQREVDIEAIIQFLEDN